MPNIDDLSHDMTYTIQGETFKFGNVHPDVLKALDEGPAASTDEEILAQLDKRIETFLAGTSSANGSRAVPEEVKRWRKLRARKDDPVPAWKIIAFDEYLVETQTRRPTEQPSPSAPGRGRTEASSGAA